MPTGQALPEGRQGPLLAGSVDVPIADADERRVMAGKRHTEPSRDKLLCNRLLTFIGQLSAQLAIGSLVLCTMQTRTIGATAWM
jgi:hypothetical protein